MMSDEDIKEYHNIGKPIKYNDKYKYVSGQMYEHHQEIRLSILLSRL